MKLLLKCAEKRSMIQTYSANLVRNLGFVAHIDAGKTTTTEAALFHCGAIHRLGKVDDGTTSTDYMPLEKERGITISSAAVTAYWQKHQLNIIDTPGHVDFTAEVERSLRVLDGAVVVFCAVAGVQPQSETVWRQASSYQIPRMVFLNKMDRPGADWGRAVAQIRDRLFAQPVLMQLPIFEGERFSGVFDLLTGQMDMLPAQLVETALKQRKEIMEMVAMSDQSLLDQFCESGTLSVEQIRAGLRQSVIRSEAVPVYFGSAFKDIGVTDLLDGVVNYLPRPTDRTVESANEFSGLAFKTTHEERMGQLTYLRVYSGTVRPGSRVLNATSEKEDSISRIFRLEADERFPMDSAQAGDIIGVTGLKFTRTGDTLCDPASPVVLSGMKFPEPVIHVSVTPRSKSDQEKLGFALAKLCLDDPTFTIKTDPETEETIISGMGELHLEVIAERLKREYGVAILMGQPKVAYKLTFEKPASFDVMYRKQSGGHGHFAGVSLVIEPLSKGSGFVFSNEIVKGALPSNFVAGVEKGIRCELETGPVDRLPLIDFRVRLIDGKFHSVDSSKEDFQTVGAMAVKEAVQRCGIVLLEPVMRLEVAADESHLAAVLADLSRRGASIKEADPLKIRAEVPLDKMFAYSTNLRNLTQGRGYFTMEPAFYDPVSQGEMPDWLVDYRRIKQKGGKK